MLNNSTAFSGFSTNDLSKTREFYQEILGLKVKETPMGALELHTPGNNPIFIYSKENHIPATFTVLNFQIKDIEKTVDEFIGKGITFEQYEGMIATDEKGICRGDKGPSIAWFKDPAGNILSLIEKR
ncbi:VOC family protein [Xanthovirga aplysinae]|uniref:VOC family protein n=1 Tax=Xanthovirga aplysinae TaxID=2529853 RepID=UPI0012BC57DC|nr:VOC family protein [Xanthovirga aplysinae]MTI32137.1 VOC family protein [Xanthovirga aplysinae]